jgi:hypothetical protein
MIPHPKKPFFRVVSQGLGRLVRSRPVVPSVHLPPIHLPQWLRRRPWLLVVGLWFVLMGIGWFAMVDLVSPGRDEVIVAAVLPAAQAEQNASLSVLGSVALSCAAVSVVLAHKLNQSQRRSGR